MSLVQSYLVHPDSCRTHIICSHWMLHFIQPGRYRAHNVTSSHDLSIASLCSSKFNVFSEICLPLFVLIVAPVVFRMQNILCTSGLRCCDPDRATGSRPPLFDFVTHNCSIFTNIFYNCFYLSSLQLPASIQLNPLILFATRSPSRAGVTCLLGYIVTNPIGYKFILELPFLFGPYFANTALHLSLQFSMWCLHHLKLCPNNPIYTYPPRDICCHYFKPPVSPRRTVKHTVLQIQLN